MIDIARALKTAATTGDVRFGLAETKKSMKNGEAKMVVVASNCPEKDSLQASPATRSSPSMATTWSSGPPAASPSRYPRWSS